MLVHGVALAAATALLRLETSAVGTAGGLAQRAVDVLGAVGAIAIFEWALLQALGRVASRRWRLWMGLLHAAAYAVVLVDHQYFLETGARLTLEQAWAGLSQLGTALGMAVATVDRRLPWRLAEIAACLAFAVFVSSRRPWMPRPRKPIVLRAAVPVAGMALWFGGAAIPSGESVLSAQAARAAAGLGSVGPDGYGYEAPRLLGARPERLPNIVLLVLESTRASAVGLYHDGKEPSDTPELDSIGAEGVVFDTAYTSVTHTSKALVGLVCGAYPRLEVDVGESRPGGNKLTCLPRLLRSLGYRTRFMQSARGDFENFPGLMANMGFESSIMREQLGGRGFRRAGYFGMDEFSMMDPALDWIGAEDRPFFLTVLTSVAHMPYETPGVTPLEGRENAFANYRRAVRHVDEFVGAFVREVEAKAPGETLFIITADHGQAFGEHRVRVHDRVPYEEGTRVPLVVKGPSWLGEPRRVGGLRQHFDVLPTVLEAIGARWDGRIPGASLFEPRGHEVVATSCQETRMCMGVRAGDLKFVYRFGQVPTEVYDLAHDPLERRNLGRSFPRGLLAQVEARADALVGAVEDYWKSGAELAFADGDSLQDGFAAPTEAGTPPEHSTYETEVDDASSPGGGQSSLRPSSRQAIQPGAAQRPGEKLAPRPTAPPRALVNGKVWPMAVKRAIRARSLTQGEEQASDDYARPALFPMRRPFPGRIEGAPSTIQRSDAPRRDSRPDPAR